MACPPDEDAVSTTSSNSMKRSPLTPIAVDGHRATDDPKLVSSPSYPSFSRSHSDDELRQRPSLYQRRKSSVPGLTLARPPYHRRRSHNRRPSPTRNSPAIPASLTPVHPNFNSERRTSLPALHFHESVKNAAPLHLDSRSTAHRDSISEDMYGALQSFTFGAPPRPSINGAGDDDDDEDERQRRDRAKMRAIDDGTRRPSLPTNSSTPVAPRSRSSLSSLSSAGIVVGERQWDEHSEPDWDIIMGDITPTKATPSPPPPSSGSSAQSEPRRPSIPIPVPMLRRRSRSADELAIDFDMRMRATTPTQTTHTASSPLYAWADRRQSRDDARGTSSSPEENAYDGYDLNFILAQNPTAIADSRLKHQASTGILRGKFRIKGANAHSSRVEDTFTGHLGANDPVYANRKAEWSFRREVRPRHPAIAPKGKDKDRSARLFDDYEGWRCEWVGRFNVYKIRSDSRAPAPGSDGAKAPYNRLQIMHAADPENKGNKLGGPRVLVHRHSRAQAFSIFRAHSMHPKKAMIPTDSVLLAVKSVLKEYTRTESTRALKTHGLTDDGDTRSQQPRAGSGSSGGSPQERSRSKSRPRGNTVHESAAISSTSNNKRSLTPGTGRSAGQTNSKSHSQSPEARSRKASARNVASPHPSISRPTTSSSVSTSRPSSLALTESSHTPNSVSASSGMEHVHPVPHWEPPSPRSPRLSTSHAEAFAMIDADTLEWYNHHRNDSGALPPLPGARAPPSHATALPPSATPSPPHGQRSALGFGERLKRAFGSSKQQQQQQQKEPVSPITDDGEEEPKTATQDGKFAPPWLTVVRRTEKEQHERMIRTLNDSFESVGLIPPQDKKKPSKPRSHKGSKSEDCPVFQGVPDDSMCMLLPLWPEETDPPRSQGLSRQSSRSARHTATYSLGHTNVGTPVPLQERKFLLVYYRFIEEQVETDKDADESNNKKRRRPHTAGERPHSGDARSAVKPGSFYAVGRLLGYDDVRSSGVRLPEKGLSVNGAVPDAGITVPPPLSDTNHEVIAFSLGKEDGVELVHEGLVKLGLMDAQGMDENGDPIHKLSEIGRAIVEMMWCGCISLMSFQP